VVFLTRRLTSAHPLDQPAEPCRGERHGPQGRKCSLSQAVSGVISWRRGRDAPAGFAAETSMGPLPKIPVKVARLLGAETVIEFGLNDGDVLVTEGHLVAHQWGRG
jgi:hypothetical protein